MNHRLRNSDTTLVPSSTLLRIETRCSKSQNGRLHRKSTCVAGSSKFQERSTTCMRERLSNVGGDLAQDNRSEEDGVGSYCCGGGGRRGYEGGRVVEVVGRPESVLYFGLCRMQKCRCGGWVKSSGGGHSAGVLWS